MQCTHHRHLPYVGQYQPVINVVVDVTGQNLIARTDNDNHPPPPPPSFDNRPPPFAVQQQLIIVRNVNNENAPENAAHRNRLAWEVVYDQELANEYGIFNRHGMRPFVPLISDRGICSYGRARRNYQPNLVWIRAEQRMAETPLEELVVRGYKGVTDISLRHLAECAPNMRRIDVTGTSVSADGIAEFRKARPLCVVIHDAETAVAETVEATKLGMDNADE